MRIENAEHLRSFAQLVLKGSVCYILLVCFISLNGSTCQTKKNAFYFTSKALFVLEKIKS